MTKAMKHNVIFIILAITLQFFLISMAQPQEPVKVLLQKGEPKITKVNTNTWVDCKMNMPIDNGDRIKTGPGEFVELSFTSNNSRIARVGENSDVFVRSGKAPYLLELLNGDILARIKDLPSGSTFEVKTPVGLSGSRGTGWKSNTNESRTTFSAFEKSIYAKGIDKSGNIMAEELIIREGWKTIVEKFEKPSRLERLTSAEFERWNRWKEDLAERMPEQKGAAQRGEMSKAGQLSEMGSSAEKAESKSETIAENRIQDKMIDSKTTTSSGGGYTPP